MIGKSVGRYRISAKLGEGGMGIVWKADDTLLGRPIALKLLSPDLASSDEARRRFLREARAVSALNHPGICGVYDAGEVDGQVYIALAWIDGRTVSAVAERSPLAIADVLRIGIRVADALGFAHAHGIIHRDITGRNIMVARDGRVVVLDFGLALAVGFSRLTSSGSRVGTLAYMAPEVARGESADARSDLYGLGVVLYEALTGSVPFESPQPGAVLYSVINEIPDPPSRRRRDTPASLEQIVMRLLAKQPADRYRDAEALLGDLKPLAIAPLSPPPRPNWADEPAEPGTPTRRRYLAILPFENPAGPEALDAAFLRGLADVLGTTLARQPGLHVTPASIAAAEELMPDLQQTARQLGANLILRATLRRSGSQLRVTWALLDPSRGRQVGVRLSRPSRPMFSASKTASRRACSPHSATRRRCGGPPGTTLRRASTRPGDRVSPASRGRSLDRRRDRHPGAAPGERRAERHDRGGARPSVAPQVPALVRSPLGRARRCGLRAGDRAGSRQSRRPDDAR